MCYILKSIFVQPPHGGPVEIEAGLDEHLLLCQPNPPASFHLSHPQSFLTPQCHKFILSRLAFGAIPPHLASTQASANTLLSGSQSPKIQDLDNCAFIFFPRWVEDGVLCRQLAAEGSEIVMRVDATFQMFGPMALDMQMLAKGRAEEHVDREMNEDDDDDETSDEDEDEDQDEDEDGGSEGNANIDFANEFSAVYPAAAFNLDAYLSTNLSSNHLNGAGTSSTSESPLAAPFAGHQRSMTKASANKSKSRNAHNTSKSQQLASNAATRKTKKRSMRFARAARKVGLYSEWNTDDE